MHVPVHDIQGPMLAPHLMCGWMNEHMISTPSSCAVLPHRYDVCALSFLALKATQHTHQSRCSVKVYSAHVGVADAYAAAALHWRPTASSTQLQTKRCWCRRAACPAFKISPGGPCLGSQRMRGVMQAAEQEEPLLTGEDGDTLGTT
jgi:hypothetical protein